MNRALDILPVPVNVLSTARPIPDALRYPRILTFQTQRILRDLPTLLHHLKRIIFERILRIILILPQKTLILQLNIVLSDQP